MMVGENPKAKSNLLSSLAEPDEDFDDFSDDDEEGGDYYDEEGIEDNAFDDRKRAHDDSSVQKPAKHRRIDGQKYDEKFFMPPTAEEMETLRETQMLFHSNLFRLQMQDLFDETSIKNKHVTKFKTWITEFAAVLKGLEKSKSYPLDKSEWIKENRLSIPLTFNNFDSCKGNFKFMAPTEVEVVGSYSLGLADKRNVNIDLALVLPKEFYQKKELVNGRFIVCRALYLAWLAKLLKKNVMVKDIHYTLHCGSHLRPILKITAEISGKVNLSVYLFPVPPPEVIKTNYLHPSVSNISSFIYESKFDDTPTPSYNWACGVDVVMVQQNEFLKENINSQNMKDGLKLFRMWWKRRHFDKGLGGMSTHVAIMYAVYLAKMHKITEQMSAYQVFRTLVLSLAESNWVDNGPCFFKDLKDQNSAKGRKKKQEVEVKEENSSHPSLYPINFTGPDEILNLAGTTSLQTFKEIQKECYSAIALLETSSSDSFESLFLSDVDFSFKFDQIIKVNIPSNNYEIIAKKCIVNYESAVVANLGPTPLTIWNFITQIMEKSLEDRVDLVSVRRIDFPIWAINVKAPQPSLEASFGLLLTDNSFAIMTKGPAGNTPEAAEFQKFWGKQSNLRRFKDGSFHEAVLWAESNATFGQRRNIPLEIVKYVLPKYTGVDVTNIVHLSTQVEEALKIGNVINFGYEYGTGEETIRSCTISFNSLCTVLRSIELPLKISTINSVSDIIRHGYVYPPSKMSVPFRTRQHAESHVVFDDAFKNSPVYLPSMDAVMFLEISGKWPEDLLAISAIKVEYLCCLAEELRKIGYTCNVFSEFIQILMDGLIFRLKVCHRREIYLKRLVAVENSESKVTEIEELKEKDTEKSLLLEKEIEILPKLNGALSNINNEHPCYSASVRLILRWVSSQLLLNQFNPISIELLCAHLFLHPVPFSSPGSPQVALLRFMKFITEIDWNSTPILVNVGGRFSADDEAEILKQFSAQRESFPKLCICTPCELRGINLENYDTQRKFKLLSTWTRKKPSSVALARLKAVSQVGMTYYLNILDTRDIVRVERLFLPPLDDYDVLIRLEKNFLARRYEALTHMKQSERKKELEKATFKPYVKDSNEKMPFVNFDPVECFVEDLVAAYSQHCLFFYDVYGGNVIGVVWKPSVKEKYDAKVGVMEGHCITPGQPPKMVANIDAFIEDFKILGKGLVKSVLKNKP